MFFGTIEIRLEFFISFNSSSSLSRDQIYLRGRDATDQEILMRERQLRVPLSYRDHLLVHVDFQQYRQLVRLSASPADSRTRC